MSSREYAQGFAEGISTTAHMFVYGTCHIYSQKASLQLHTYMVHATYPVIWAVVHRRLSFYLPPQAGTAVASIVRQIV